MGASVQPDPQDVARIQANVAKMRAADPPASEDEVLAYLQHEDAQASAPQPESTLKGFGRSVLQHGLFNFGDELGVVDPAKQAQFAKDHKVLDFLGTLTGGAIAPIAATLAAPELATAGGAAALGGAAGLMSGAGEGTDLESRAHNAALGGALGLVSGAAGAKAPRAVAGALLGAGTGAATAPDGATMKDRLGRAAIGAGIGAGTGQFVAPRLGGVGSEVVDRILPSRVVRREAAPLIAPADVARMDAMNAQQPGSASLATSVISQPKSKPRLLPMVRQVGGDIDASRGAEAAVGQQQQQIALRRKDLGQQMNALDAEVPITPSIRDALGKAGAVLGRKAVPRVPRVAQDVQYGGAPSAAQRALPAYAGQPADGGSFEPETPTIGIQDLHDVLSRLRTGAREQGAQYARFGRSGTATGPSLTDWREARDALQAALYEPKVAPEFAALDKAYADAMTQHRSSAKVLEAIQDSRDNYGALRVGKKPAGSLGGSLPSATPPGMIKGAATAAMNALFGDYDKKVARAVAKHLIAPGDATVVSPSLFDNTGAALRNGMLVPGSQAVRSLFDNP